jgi:hypothetical protein
MSSCSTVESTMARKILQRLSRLGSIFELLIGTYEGQRSAWGNCSATERYTVSDLLEPRFWIDSELPTIRESVRQ